MSVAAERLVLTASTPTVRTRFLARHPRLSLALLVVIFLAAGTYTTIQTDNYLSIFWHIADCKWKPPYANHVMVGCKRISGFYRTGALVPVQGP